MKNRFGQTFAGLNDHIPVKTVADDDVGIPFKNVFPFDVADKIEGTFFEDLMRFLGQLVSLGTFFAVAQKPDSGFCAAENSFGINISHNGELEKMARFAVDVGADKIG